MTLGAYNPHAAAVPYLPIRLRPVDEMTAGPERAAAEPGRAGPLRELEVACTRLGCEGWPWRRRYAIVGSDRL